MLGPDVSRGSKASIHDGPVYVRFTLDSDRIADIPERPLRAIIRTSPLFELRPRRQRIEEDQALTYQRTLAEVAFVP